MSAEKGTCICVPLYPCHLGGVFMGHCCYPCIIVHKLAKLLVNNYFARFGKFSSEKDLKNVGKLLREIH